MPESFSIRYCTFVGGYRKLDQYVLGQIEAHLNGKVRTDYDRDDHLFDRFDDCLETSNAHCLEEVCTEWKRHDHEFKGAIKHPEFNRAFSKIMKQSEKILQKMIKSIKKHGKVDMREFNKDIKELYTNEEAIMSLAKYVD